MVWKLKLTMRRGSSHKFKYFQKNVLSRPHGSCTTLTSFISIVDTSKIKNTVRRYYLSHSSQGWKDFESEHKMSLSKPKRQPVSKLNHRMAYYQSYVIKMQSHFFISGPRLADHKKTHKNKNKKKTNKLRINGDPMAVFWTLHAHIFVFSLQEWERYWLDLTKRKHKVVTERTKNYGTGTEMLKFAPFNTLNKIANKVQAA